MFSRAEMTKFSKALNLRAFDQVKKKLWKNDQLALLMINLLPEQKVVGV